MTGSITTAAVHRVGRFTEEGIERYVGTPVVVQEDVYGTFCFYDREPRSEPFSTWQVTLVELMGNWVSYERERASQQRQLERERNRLDEFASIVSHDLRSPLSVAVGHLELARETHDDENLDAVADALTRMDDLVADVLSLAKAGVAELEPTTVAVDALAEACWNALSTAEPLTVETDLRVRADPARLRQAVENLLTNAVLHGGESVRVHVGALDSGDGLYVADDGPGIPADEREQVVEPGYSTATDGTGFGLDIISTVTEAHGGGLTVTESAMGGARFELTGFPVEGQN